MSRATRMRHTVSAPPKSRWRRPTIALTAPAPAASPSASPAAPAANQSENQEQQQRADSGVDDRGDNALAKVDAQSGQQPPADEGSYDADDEVIDDTVSGASDDLAGKPSRNEADCKDDD